MMPGEDILMKALPFGHIVKLWNGLHARVLVDDPERPAILATIIISGWGDPIRWLAREKVIDGQEKKNDPEVS